MPKTFHDAHQRPQSRHEQRNARLLRVLYRERLAILPALLSLLAVATALVAGVVGV